MISNEYCLETNFDHGDVSWQRRKSASADKTLHFFIFKFPKHVTQKPRLSLKKTSGRLKLVLCSHLQEIVYSGLAKICVHTEESWALKHVRNEVF